MFMSFLIDKNLKLSQKVKLLDLLYFFTDAPTPFTLKVYLPQFIIELPLKSSELTRGEPIYNDYVNSLRKILVALELSLSQDILTIVVNIACRERSIILDGEIQVSLVKFIRHLESSKQASLVSFYWDNVFGESGRQLFADERRQLLFDKVFVEFAKSCHKPVFIDLMCANICSLFDLIDVELREAATFESICMNRINAFKLIDLIYKRLLKDEIFSTSAKLCIAYETKKFGIFEFYF